MPSSSPAGQGEADVDADCAWASEKNASSAHDASSARGNAVRVMEILPGGAASCNADAFWELD
jgi:hypothetical protein